MNKNMKKSKALSEEILNNAAGGNIHRETLGDGRVLYSVWGDDRRHLLDGLGMGVHPDALLPKLRASFDTEKDAVEYARDHGIDTTIKDYRISTGRNNAML